MREGRHGNVINMNIQILIMRVGKKDHVSSFLFNTSFSSYLKNLAGQSVSYLTMVHIYFTFSQYLLTLSQIYALLSWRSGDWQQDIHKSQRKNKMNEEWNHSILKLCFFSHSRCSLFCWLWFLLHKVFFFVFPLPCLEMYLIYKAAHESTKIRISGGHYSGSDMN